MTSSHSSAVLPVMRGSTIAAVALFLGLSVGAQETVPVPDPDLPEPLAVTHFEAVLGNSPFLRTLNLSETFSLRGIAEIDGEQVATLYNRETEKSVLVSASKANPEQMKLLAVNGNPGLLSGMTSVSATIAVGEEEVELKFEPNRVAPRPGNKKPSGGGSSQGGKPSEQGKGGERKGPSQQDIDRYKSLTPEQQEKFREYMRQTMQKYPDISREERGNMIRGALTRLADGRDITVDSSSGGSSTGGGPSATRSPTLRSSSGGSGGPGSDRGPGGRR